MIRMSAQTESGILDAIQRNLADAPNTLGVIGQRVASGPTAQSILRQLKTEPGTPKYPIRWTSEKQRRYVMWKLRKENNLPYRRTHKLSQSWRVVALIPAAGVAQILLRNDTPYATFVQGGDQQGFHKDTGWKRLDTDVLPNYRQQLTAEYLKLWSDAVTRGL